jgi:GNAT superfamily N-acetyltransferase
VYNVYQLAAGEYYRYRQHLLKLDTESRSMRFGTVLSDGAIDKLCDTFQHDPDLHKIFVIENDELEVVGAGHIALVKDNMELAFSVLTQYRAAGMGSALLKRCLLWCQAHNIKTGYMVCLTSNAPMRKLALKHGLTVSKQSSWESEALVTLPSADIYTHISDTVSSNIANWDHSAKVSRKFARLALKSLTFQ